MLSFLEHWGREGLGISCISKNPHYETIKLISPHALMCDSVCEEKKGMRELDDRELGGGRGPLLHLMVHGTPEAISAKMVLLL